MNTNKMKNTPTKVQHIWTVLCQNSIIDSQTNNISLNSVLEELRIGKTAPLSSLSIPEGGEVVPFGMHIVSLWKRVGDDKSKEILTEGELEIVDPNGKSLVKTPLPIKIEAGKERFRYIMRFSNFKVTVPGEYVFKIKTKNGDNGDLVQVAETYLTVRIDMSIKK